MTSGAAGRAASCAVVATSAAGTFLEFHGGELDGQMLHLPRTGALRSDDSGEADHADVGYRPPTPYRELNADERARADATAAELLVSMLDPHQRRDHARDGTFWVDLGRHGRIRFGRPHHLLHRPVGGAVFERVLCVVTEGNDRDPTPPADVWTSLLLSVRADADAFFEVANNLGSTPRTDHDHRVDDLSHAQLGRLAEGHYRQGRFFDGAVAEAEVAHRAEAKGARTTAVGAAVRAAITGAAPADPPTNPSAVERRERWEAAAERLVATVGPTDEQLERWRRLAVRRVTAVVPSETRRMDRLADTLIGVWMSSN